MNIKYLFNHSNQIIDFYHAGEYVVKNGSPAYGMFYIQHGSIELIYKTEEGFFDKVIKNSGETIGEDYLSTPYYTFDAFALKDSRLFFIDKNFILNDSINKE